jgi:hypothetical protein
MRSLRVLVLLAGSGVALFAYLPASVDRSNSPDQLQRIAASRFISVARLSAFSPPISLATAPATSSPPVTTEVPPAWQTTVAVAAPTPVVLPKTLSPTDPDARYKLVLDIQQQLKRVGCYLGRMDGSWGLATKNAMKAFSYRVNATLPLDKPDYVQLALIRSHGEKTCGACPAGQSLSASGRCVGLPITAQGKQPDAPRVANTTQNEVLPWKASSGPHAAAPQPLFRPVPTTVVSTEPLPERMAIGAPVTTPADVQQSAPPITPGAAATPPVKATAVLNPNAAAMEPPMTAALKAERRAHPDDRGFAGDVGWGTPRYNLLLSLGGLY